MKTTTTFKAMMAMAFATIAMTANANTNTKGNTWRNPAPAYHVEVRYDARHNRHYEADWRRCHHNHIDRYGNRTFCHHCGAEMVWRGGHHNGHYDVIPPRPMVPVHHHGGAPVPPPPAHGNGHAHGHYYR